MKLLIGMLFSHEAKAQGAMRELFKEFGEPSIEHEYPFDFTNYYEQEMGSGLKRRWLLFDKDIEKQDLVELKNFTQQVEKKFMLNKKRTVNLDPGALSEKSLILAAGKFKTFKIKLSEDVYAHTVLKLNPIQTFFHTFPEFRKKEVQDFFVTKSKVL